jgi:hypothetical protein
VVEIRQGLVQVPDREALGALAAKKQKEKSLCVISKLKKQQASNFAIWG